MISTKNRSLNKIFDEDVEILDKKGNPIIFRASISEMKFLKLADKLEKLKIEGIHEFMRKDFLNLDDKTSKNINDEEIENLVQAIIEEVGNRSQNPSK